MVVDNLYNAVSMVAANEAAIASSPSASTDAAKRFYTDVAL